MSAGRIKKRYLTYIVLAVLACAAGLALLKKPASDKTVIKINDYTITAGEFNELYSELGFLEDTPEMRKRFLDNLIDRKLILQEAQRVGLDRERDFLKSIEKFWEQSLLTITVDKKTKEIGSVIRVNEDDIRARYDAWITEHPDEERSYSELREDIGWKLLKEEEASRLRDWLNGLRDDAQIEIDKRSIGVE